MTERETWKDYERLTSGGFTIVTTCSSPSRLLGGKISSGEAVMDLSIWPREEQKSPAREFVMDRQLCSELRDSDHQARSFVMMCSLTHSSSRNQALSSAPVPATS
jgi:hypothetical protein